MSSSTTPTAAAQVPATPTPAAGRRAVIIVGGAVAIIVLVAALSTPHFASVDNVRAILRNASIVGIVAVAMTPVTLSGNFVSLGTTQSAMAGSVSFVALVGSGVPAALAIVIVLAGLSLIGVVQGLVVAGGLNPIITTLAVGAIVFGVVADQTGGGIVRVGAHPVSWGDAVVLGIPLEVLVFGLVTLLVWLLMARTVIGRQTILTGANREAAELSGISLRRVTIAAFVVFSLGLGLAGVLSGAGFGQATQNSFGNLTIDVVAAILVGGTAIAGGDGSPLRSAAGAVLIAVISNLMVLNDFSTGGRMAVQGGVVVSVVILLEVLKRRTAQR